MKENTTLSLKAGAKKRKSVVDRKNKSDTLFSFLLQLLKISVAVLLLALVLIYF